MKEMTLKELQVFKETIEKDKLYFYCETFNKIHNLI
jgi:hypothetical protein